MAKRKRLTPANTALFATPAPETKSLMQAPIADVAREASGTAALNEMAETLTRARSEGRMVVTLPLDQIETDHLVRDRVVVEEEALEALMVSLRNRGQQTPVEVVELGPERYGLISGWRRCAAIHRLAEDTGEPATVQALLRRPEDAEAAYQAMVEENEVRVDLSMYERAHIVIKSVEAGVFADDRSALNSLFASAPKAKRSKIGSFLPIVRALDGVVKHPQAISERVGLQLSRQLVRDDTLAGRLREGFTAAGVATPEEEQAVLTELLAVEEKTLKAGTEPKIAKKFRDETVGDFTLRHHADGGISVVGKPLPASLEGPLKRLLLGASRR